jgi:tetraacyldisaccharide 4'-kinase
MTRVLFVTNGHGEVSIAKRIARELRELGDFVTDHFPLVGAGHGESGFSDVGPQAVMPSGGLVAMGNLRALAADVQAGFVRLLLHQLAFARGARERYAAVVAVGDVYALLFARLIGRPAVFVGTAKSVHVAPYGPGERRVLRWAQRVFVRDAATAAALRAHGVAADAPGNVIVDLLATAQRVEWPAAAERIALLPGSRDRAYDDAQLLAEVLQRVVRRVPGTVAVMSIAPGLDPSRFVPALAGQPPIAAWRGDLGALLADATLALGQAGTANEAAAACGVPVVAMEFDGARRSTWYRMRQARLLGEALAIVPGDPEAAATAIAALLGDRPRRDRMARIGRERMGAGGGAAAIARAICSLVAPAS